MTALAHIAILKRGQLVAATFGAGPAAAFLRRHNVPFMVAYSVLRPFMSRSFTRRLETCEGTQ